MRAAILFILALFMLQATETTAQVFFEQDFESGMEPMTLVDIDGQTPHPNVAAYPDAWNVANPGFGNGTNVAVSNSWYSPAGAADDWMITPAIEITNPNTIVSWSAKAQDPSFPDGYEVRVSTTGNEVADFADIIFSTPAEVTEFTERSAALGDYAGDTIYIAWRNNSNDQYLLLVDDIKVEAIQSLAVSATEITTDRYHEILEDVEITTTIVNNGAVTINSLDVSWTDGIVTYTDNLTDLDLSNGQSIDYTHSETFLPSAAITYDIQVSISNPNGETDDETDNVVEGQISAVSIVPVKRMVLEEGTGSWCGWCPRGFVAMEEMSSAYPETFIGIAVHNGDPMAFAEYDNNIGLSGYPSCNADRVLLDVSVSSADFQSYYNQLTERVSPASVDATATFDPATGEATIEAKATFRTLIEDLDMRMNVVILEDSIKGSGSGYNQANFYSFQSQDIPLVGAGLDWQAAPHPIPASEMYYNHTARAILGGYSGENVFPAGVTANQEVAQTYTYTVPANYNPELMSAVVLLMDGNTGAIVNAGKAKFEILSSTQPDLANERLDVFPNPAKDLVNIALTLDGVTPVNLTVYNAMGQTVATRYLGTLSGEVSVPFDASRLTAGAYTFRLNLGDQVAVKQVIVE